MGRHICCIFRDDVGHLWALSNSFFYHFINFLFIPSEVSLNLKSLEKIGKQWAMLIWKLEWYLLLTNKAFWILVWNQVCFKLLLLY
jgi:hypothetical protein